MKKGTRPARYGEETTTALRSPECSRRRFLGLVATASAPLIVPSRALGLDGAVAPSNRIVMGGIGVGPRARAILPNFLWFADVQWVAVADCRRSRLESAKRAVDEHYGTRDCAMYTDFRELLARPDIDAVLVATGNRWHATMSMLAARAGKDVYCEKPVTLTIEEGRRLVDTCRRFGTIYQAGTQRRATASYRFARDIVRSGRIGRLRRVEMQVWAGATVPHARPAPVPDGFDYDQWLGPVPWRPYVPARVEGHGWMCFWDTADGMHVDMGVHYTDQMQWTLGRDDTGPIEFEASDVVWPDPAVHMSETAIRGVFRCRYTDGIECVMYQRGAFKDRYLRYVGDEGWIQVDDDTDVVTAQPASLLRLRRPGGPGWADAGDHIRDFLDGVRTRRPTACHPEVAHRSQTIALAMTISARLGRRLRWDPVREVFDDETANRMLRREARAPWTA